MNQWLRGSSLEVESSELSECNKLSRNNGELYLSGPAECSGSSGSSQSSSVLHSVPASLSP